MSRFILESKFKPSGDQPAAIEALAKGVLENQKHQVLLGVTGFAANLRNFSRITRWNSSSPITTIINRKHTSKSETCISKRIPA